MINENNRIKVIIAFIVAAVILLVISLVVNSRGNQIDEKPIEGSRLESNQVKIVNGEELLKEVGGFNAYDQIGKEMYTFAKTAYPKYGSEDKPFIGFEIAELTKPSKNEVKLKGVFGSVDNEIEIELKLLNKDKFEISITDLETKLNIDEFLKSNGQRNQFIGNLPYETEGYVIEYLPESDEFTVNVFNNSNNYDQALEFMKSGLSETFSRETIIRYGAGDSDFDFGF